MRLLMFDKTQELEEYPDNEWRIAMDQSCERQ